MTTVEQPVLITRAGDVIPLLIDRWMREPDEDHLLERAVSPVLDVGCGPGRHVAELARRGIVTLGIDVSPSAVELARERGAPALLRSIFDRIPATGRWATILLIDGNIGIGGDPVTLLQRCTELMGPGGKILAEFGAPGSNTESVDARIVGSEGSSGWFAWATVSIDDAATIAATSGLEVSGSWAEGGRWFASLVCPTASSTHPSR